MNERNAPLNIDAVAFRKNANTLTDQIAEFLASIDQRPVTSAEQPKQIKSFLKPGELPLNGAPLDEILNHASRVLFDHSLFNGHPRFWGYITSSPAPAGILGELLAATVNSNVGAYVLSPVATEIERQTIRWIGELIGYSKDCSGVFVSGGNMANITGLLAARKAKANWDIRQQGLGDRRMLIYCSKGTHTWIQKAADLFGFGTDSIRWIAMDKNHRMNVDALDEQIVADKKSGHNPFIVVGTAGSIGTGSIDPLDGIAAVCKEHNLWFHVDGAYGAPAAVVPEVTNLFKGIEQADSIALDPHKWLYSPLEAGCTLVKDERMLIDAFSFHPEYYNFDGKQEDPVTNFLDMGIQNSRGFKALKVWIALKQVGRNGYIKMIGDDIKLAQTLFELAKAQPELEAVTHNLSTVTFRYVPAGASDNGYVNQLNEKIVNEIQAGGEVFVSNAVVDEKYCLRACIVNFRSTKTDIEALINVVLKVGRKAVQQISV